MEYLRVLGPLVLDHRFRRMTEAMLKAAETVYDHSGLQFRGRWTSTYLLLAEEGSLGVTDIADRIGLTHPAVISILDEMSAARLVTNIVSRTDRRRREISLTSQALAMKTELVRIWEELANSQAQRFAAAGCDIVRVLNEVEDGMNDFSIASEVLSRLEPVGATRGQSGR